ncbi:MAG TPA: FKBP-type peptidyl-prolyl cis-trans isomerase, partial [Solirubrobacteraceae bacterium]|nr:FKBP-type peptidyl-prolyl cis-trans isomerase [Solirubrobacteraceae bacterium]
DKVFDSSWTRHQTFGPFTLGQGAVIKGWDQGVVGMKVGGRRELIIPSSLAYGKAGSGSTIPPNSALVFVVDLLSSTG